MPGSPEMPPPHHSLHVKKPEPNCNQEPILISRLSGQQELRLKLKQNEAVTGPKVYFHILLLNLYSALYVIYCIMNYFRAFLCKKKEGRLQLI